MYLSDVDGAFSVAEVMRGLEVYGLKEDFFYNLIDTIRTITPVTLQELANKYLNTDDLLEVVAGNQCMQRLELHRWSFLNCYVTNVKN